MSFLETVRTLTRRGVASNLVHPSRSRASWINGSTGEDWQRLAGSVHSNGTAAICLQAIMDKIAQSAPVAGIYDAKKNFKPSDVDTRFLEMKLASVFGSSFYEIIAFSQKAFGPAYGVVERDERGVLQGIYPFMDPQVRPDVENGEQIYFVMPHGGTGKPIKVRVVDMIDLSSGLPDPKDASRRVSTLQMNLRAVCTDNECETFNAAIMRAPFPGIIASPKDGSVEKGKGKEVKQKLEDDLETMTGDRRGQRWVLPVPSDVSTLGFSPDQMAVSETKKLSLQQICAALGVDPMAVGLPSETKTYANYSEARRAMIEDTVLPTWDHILAPLEAYALANKWFTNPATKLIVDRSKYVELDSDKFDKDKNARENFKTGLTNRDEARAECGYPPLASKDTRTFFDMGGTVGGAADGETNTKKGLSRAQRIAAELLHDQTDEVVQ